MSRAVLPTFLSRGAEGTKKKRASERNLPANLVISTSTVITISLNCVGTINDGSQTSGGAGNKMNMLFRGFGERSTFAESWIVGGRRSTERQTQELNGAQLKGEEEGSPDSVVSPFLNFALRVAPSRIGRCHGQQNRGARRPLLRSRAHAIAVLRLIDHLRRIETREDPAPVARIRQMEGEKRRDEETRAISFIFDSTTFNGRWAQSFPPDSNIDGARNKFRHPFRPGAGEKWTKTMW